MGDGRNDGASSLRGTWRPSSLRGAKRRSNPDEKAVTLDCRAPLAMTTLSHFFYYSLSCRVDRACRVS
ncbi:MAG: hypothetical protein LBT00_07480 [Spirochaetaceae bacterium]|nr:hypothetical protein [Spirochaetaceae bacterium]